MFKVTRSSDNRVDIEVSGKLDSADMRIGLDELVSKSAGIEHGRMMYRITDFDLPTLGAVGVELSRIPRLFRLVRQFERAAVISDKNWIKRAGEIEGALIPGLRIKSFGLDEEAKAEAWLAE